MKKVFEIAAMLLALAACNKIDTEIQTIDKAEGITITAQLAPKGSGATARAVSEDAVNNKIVSDWAENEHIAILYTKDETKYAADATITAVDGGGTATITFTVEAGTPNNTACTLVYPLSAAKDDHSGVKDAATLLAAQDGTLNANLDVRVGEGTIQTTTPGLTVTTQPEAQFAIFKFTVKNSDASATIDVKPLTVTIGAQDYVITPASATSELFAALPPIAGQTVSFTATDGGKTYTCSKDGISFDKGKYYQSTLKMALDKVTWDSSNASGLNVLSGSSQTIDGITIKCNTGDGAVMCQYKNGAINFDIYYDVNTNGFTFTNTLGKNFTKIEITSQSGSEGEWESPPSGSLGSGWSYSSGKATWTGDAASVDLLKYSRDFTAYASSIVFTLR